MTTITDWRDGIKNAYNSVTDYFGVKLAANSGVDIGDVDVASVAVVGVDHETLAISGKTAVTTAGTAVALGSQAIAGPLAIRALHANTGLIYVGNDNADDVASTNGFELAADETIILSYVANLSDIYVDSAVNGEGICWLALEVV